MSEDASAEGGREGEDNEPDAEASEGSEWIRIDDLADKPKKIVIFHRQTNPNYYHQNEYLPAVKENVQKSQPTLSSYHRRVTPAYALSINLRFPNILKGEYQRC